MIQSSRSLVYQDPTTQTTLAWLSSAQVVPPKTMHRVNDQLTADQALKWAHAGESFLWQGDFQSAKLLLEAVRKRLVKKSSPPKAEGKDYFHKVRMHRIEHARVLGRLLVPVEIQSNRFVISMRRAPDIHQAFEQVFGSPENWLRQQEVSIQANPNMMISLREVLGIIGAFEWYKKGISLPYFKQALKIRHGVFSPLRSEYLTLVAEAPFPKNIQTALDIGTGSGVLAALLLQRGVAHVHISDIQPQALICAEENLTQLGFDQRYTVHQTAGVPNIHPLVQLVICNPPWIPTKPSSPLEQAMYDSQHLFLKDVLQKSAAVLVPDGECWIIMSDLAEHLGLRTSEELPAWIDGAGWQLISKTGIQPKHGKVNDSTDWLHQARQKEVTYLWRLKKKHGGHNV